VRVNLRDDFPNHPAIVGLSDAAFRLYVVGLCYSAKYLTDGYVPATAVRPGKGLAQLLERGLWAARDGGYYIHDWADYNLPADRVRQFRKTEAERLRRLRERKNREGPDP